MTDGLAARRQGNRALLTGEEQAQKAKNTRINSKGWASAASVTSVATRDE